VAIPRQTTILQHLRRTILRKDPGDLADALLLECWLADGDDAAFEALVRRHGAMVLGVCRRVLGDAHEAEDAFQATFLVFVRKAASIVPRAQVGNWLHGVAYKAALRSRSAIARRRVVEKRVAEMISTTEEPDQLWQQLQPLLDKELQALPDNYRLPIVLCDLEGKTRKQVSRQLGWAEGTVASRLARGRALLAKRMRRHGLPLSGAALAAALTQQTASAALPTSLLISTLKAASAFALGQAAAGGAISTNITAIAEGVIRAMVLHKLSRLVVVGLVIGAFVCGAGEALRTALALEPSAGLKVAAASPIGKLPLHNANDPAADWGLAHQVADQANAGIDEIVKAWRAREQRVNSFSATWKVKHTYVKGSLLNPKLPERINPNGLLVPAEDYTFQGECALKSQGSKARYEYQWELWNTQLSKFNPSTQVDVFDGVTNTLFHLRKNGLSSASVRPEDYAMPFGMAENRAILLALRPFSLASTGLIFNHLAIGPKQTNVNGVDCMVVQDDRGAGFTLWIDPKKGFAIVRCVLEEQRWKRWELNVDWDLGDAKEWLPQRWEFVDFDPDGSVRSRSVGFDVRYELNKALPDSTFEIDYPPFTLIIDGKTRKEYFVSSDKSKREITPQELINAKGDVQKLDAPLKKSKTTP
jgi:RNA polymerase sigma factor (sigma-70 family)